MKNIPIWKVRRDVITKEEVETNPNYGMHPDKRPLELHLRFGLINLDKPPNPSSHEVVAWVKKILGVKHAGHGGTLEARPVGKILW